MSYETTRDVALDKMQGSFAVLLDSVREIAREEAAAAAIDSSAGGLSADVIIDQAEQICSSDQWSKQFELRIQDSFQKVLPSLIKRFRAEMDKALESGSGDGTGSGGGVGIDEVVNSAEMKEMLEERFRSMLLYLKQEVIPKAVGQP